jgi:hypothetical protein
MEDVVNAVRDMPIDWKGRVGSLIPAVIFRAIQGRKKHKI